MTDAEPDPPKVVEKIEVEDSDTDEVIETCRYIDQTHLNEIVGDINDTSDLIIYHANVVSLKKMYTRLRIYLVNVNLCLMC